MSENTPVHKVLFGSSAIVVSIFLVLYLIVNPENKKLAGYYQKLSASDKTGFGTLTDYHKLKKDSGNVYVYSYKVPDAYGRLHEISEAVDRELHRKLRVGDTVQVKRGIFQVFGRETVLSRIDRNQAPYPLYSFLEDFSLAGLYFGAFLFLAGFLKMLKG